MIIHGISTGETPGVNKRTKMHVRGFLYAAEAGLLAEAIRLLMTLARGWTLGSEDKLS